MSLSTTTVIRPDTCPTCGSGRVICLDLTLTDGTPVVFLSCRGCERRAYFGPDGDLDVVDVLTRTVKPGKGSVPERTRG
ncbi:MAG TPA: hypothetical protein VIJ71_05305 [Mycobacteriales bacterium]